jgi:hypothetical protein
VAAQRRAGWFDTRRAHGIRQAQANRNANVAAVAVTVAFAPTSTRASSGTRRTGSPPPDDHGSTSPLGRITVIRWCFLTCHGGNDDR